MLGPISYDRYQDTNRLLSEILGSELASLVDNGQRAPDILVLNAGLWDIQDRPLSEYTKYLSVLLRLVSSKLPDTKLVWLLSSPISLEPPVQYLTGLTYRTNCALLSRNSAAQVVLPTLTLA